MPADDEMIKTQIVKELGGHKVFDRKVQDALQAAWSGYIAHTELSAAVAKLPGHSEQERKAWRDKGREEFFLVLKKHSQRKLPQEPMPCKAKSIDLQGCRSTPVGFAQVVSRLPSGTKIYLDEAFLEGYGWRYRALTKLQVELCFNFTKLKAVQMQDATELDYNGARWDDAAGVQLCEALRYAHAHGGLAKLKTLVLDFNDLGDGFVTSFVALLDEGGLAGVEMLGLSYNDHISNQGMKKLVAAIERGGLPSCSQIDLRGCKLANLRLQICAVEEAAKQRGGMAVITRDPRRPARITRDPRRPAPTDQKPPEGFDPLQAGLSKAALSGGDDPNAMRSVDKVALK